MQVKGSLVRTDAGPRAYSGTPSGQTQINTTHLMIAMFIRRSGGKGDYTT